MKLDIRAFALTAGLLWGGAILVVGIVNYFLPAYGRAFLLLLASVYPGYDAGTSIGQAVIGSLYGLVDGTIGAAVFAWLYNVLAGVARKH